MRLVYTCVELRGQAPVSSRPNLAGCCGGYSLNSVVMDTLLKLDRAHAKVSIKHQCSAGKPRPSTTPSQATDAGVCRGNRCR
jgi:hypothetical protein